MGIRMGSLKDCTTYVRCMGQFHSKQGVYEFFLILIVS